MLVEVADQRAVGDVKWLFLTQPAAELDGGPVELAGQGGIVDDGQDLGLDGGGGEFARTADAGPIGEAILTSSNGRTSLL